MQVGTTKDQGLYDKPSAAAHPGALAAGTLPQYDTKQAVCEAGHSLLSITDVTNEWNRTTTPVIYLNGMYFTLKGLGEPQS